MQKEENFHSHDSQLPGSAHVMHKKVTLPITVNLGRRCGCEANQQFSPFISHHSPAPNLSLHFHSLSFLPFFSTFNCSLTFSSEFKQKRLLCLLVLLLSISKFHIRCTYKPLLSTIFLGIHKRQGEGKLAWRQIWQKKKIPLLFPKPRPPTEGKGKPSWGKTAWVSQKMPGGERHEGSCSPRAGAFCTRHAEPSAEIWEPLPYASWAMEGGHATLHTGPSSAPCPSLTDPAQLSAAPEYQTVSYYSYTAVFPTKDINSCTITFSL